LSDLTVPAAADAPSVIPAAGAETAGETESGKQTASEPAVMTDELSTEKESGWSASNITFAGLVMVIVLAGTAALGYVTYAGNKKKGEDK